MTVSAVIALIAWLLPSVHVRGGVGGLLVAAAVVGLVNALVGPILRLVTLPLQVVTLGLFSLVVNAALLGVAAGLTDYLDVGGFLETLVAALLVSVLCTVAHAATGALARGAP